MSSFPIPVDRVGDTSTTMGTGTYTLSGTPLTGYQAFSAVGDGKSCYYVAFEVDANGNPSGGWEVGLGTYTSSGTTLSRDTVLASSNGGAAVNWAAGTRRIFVDLPASVVSSIYGPAFAVNKNGTNQTGITDNTDTKLTWSNEVFDSDNCFASDKFTPTLAGKYVINAAVYFSAGLAAGSDISLELWKNGAEILETATQASGGAGTHSAVSGTWLVSMNGSTDYLELYIYQHSGGDATVLGNTNLTFFQGAFLRT